MGDRTNTLVPYVPTAACDWDAEAPDSRWRAVEGTLVFVDMSGFTNLSERLAEKGRIGAEELTSVLNQVFGRMLDVVYQRGGSLLKFGGDALLLIFTTDDHVMQACAATVEMRSVLRTASKEPTSVGRLNLRMSSGIHTGEIDLFLVGESHRELLVTGPAASITTEMEGTADAGEIVISSSVAESLPSGFVGNPKGDGWLLRKRSINHPLCGWDPRASHTYDELAQFVPKGLREHLSAGIEDSEHRIATVAFLKFKGIDGVMSEFGAEQVAEMLDELVTTVERAADEEGITFLASDIDADGGKIILVAGIPSSQHDDEGRVLRAARQIIDSGCRLPIRIGVNRGHVFSGNVGTFFRRTYTVMGDTVNLAARLMAAAEQGMVYATPSVLNLASTLYSSESLPPFHVKGKTQPIRAFSVLEEVGVRPPETTTELPFRGREAELEMLVGIVNTCSRLGRGGVMTISGDTGIGKSRLISEVLSHCEGTDTLILQAEPTGVDNAYWAFRDPLRRQLGVDRSTQQQMAESLSKAVRASVPGLEWAIPLLGDVMHIEVEDNETTRAIDPQFRPEMTADAVVEVLSAEHTRPVAMVAEDGQWLDEASLALLKRVGEAAKERPWTVMVTTRSNGSGFEPLGDEIHLSPLDDKAARSIAVEMTRATPLRPDELDSVVSKADGNPLFLGEILRVVSETGSAASLPESLDAVVSTEIDTLPPLPRKLLQYASVLGRRFRRAVLDEFLAPEGVALDDATVRELEKFIEVEDETDDRLAFRHNVVHDIAYESLSYSKRRELHARAGDVIERQAGDSSEAVAEYLATHYSRSGAYEKAWRYSLIAAEKAKDAYANAEAVAHYRRALEAGQAIGVDQGERARVNRLIGDSLDRLGAFDQALVSYRRAQRALEDPRSKAGLLRVQAAMLKRMGKLSMALGTLTRGLNVAEASDAEDVAVEILAERAAIRLYQGRHSDAIKLAERAIHIAGSDKSEAVALAEVTADWARTASGLAADHESTRRALEIGEEIGDLHIQGAALNNLGMYAYFSGDWDEASDFYAKGSETYERTGDRVAAAYGTANTAEIKSDQGHLVEAEAGFREALHVLQSAGDKFMSAFVLSHLARIEVRRGMLTEGLGYFDEALRLYETMGAGTEIAETKLRKIEALVLAGKNEEASDAIAHEARPDSLPQQLRALAHRTRGFTDLAGGRLEDALAHFKSSYSIAKEHGSEIDELHAIHAMAAAAPIETEMSDRATEICLKLGIVAVPVFPSRLLGNTLTTVGTGST